MNPSHLFFDLDGTVTDPREGIVRSISHALTAMNRMAPSPETLSRFIGPPLAKTFESLLATTDQSVIRAAIDAYRERFSTIGILENRIYPEIPATLKSLGDVGFTLYLVTSKPAVYAERIVEHFSLAGHFARIYGPALGDLNGTKVVLVRRALAAERLDPTAVAVIGDRGDDLVGARENGVRFVAVTWGYGSHNELEGADFIVNSPMELKSPLTLREGSAWNSAPRGA